MFKLNLKAIKLSVLLGLLLVAWLAKTATGIMAQTLDLAPAQAVIVNLAHRASGLAFTILLVVTIGLGLLALARILGKLLPKDLFEFGEEEAASALAEAEAVTDTLDTLGERLDTIEQNRDQAIAQLRDANILASTLVGLIRRTVAKAKSLAEEAAQLEAALDALVGGDPVTISRAAGALNDEHIRNLMLDTNGTGDDRYRASVINLAATQTGALRSQAGALGELSTNWIESLARYRSQTARLVLVIDALDAARPLASIEANLGAAQRFLMLEGNPEAWQITRDLPTAGAVRPMLEGYR